MKSVDHHQTGKMSNLIVKSNYFRLTFLPNIIIYKYSVRISPNIDDENDVRNIMKRFIKQNSSVLFECYYENGFIYSRSLIIINRIRNNIVNLRKGFRNERFTINLKYNGQFNSLAEAGIDLQKLFRFFVEKQKKLINNGTFALNEYPFPKDGISVIVGFRFLIIPIPDPLILISRQVIFYDGKIQIFEYKSISDEADKTFGDELNCGPKKEFEFFRKCRAEIENCIESFGIKIHSELFETNGTLLFHPEIIPDSPDKPFFSKPSNTINFAILCFHPFDSDKMEKFEESFVKKTKKFGMNFEKCFETQFVDIRNDSEIATVFQNLKIRDIHFVFIGLSACSSSDYVFEKIKSNATSDHGLVTQIFIIEKLDWNIEMPEFYSSLAIKSCLKLGGQPNIIDPTYWNAFPFKPESTMVVGTSCYQFKLDNIRKNLFSHSIVASMDTEFCQNISIERVSIKQNDKQLFEEIFESLLKEYHKEHGKYPKNIIIFHGKRRIHDDQYTDLKTTAKSIDERIKVTSFSIDKSSPIRFIKNDDEKVPIGTCVDLKFQQSNGSTKEFAICSEIGNEAVRYKTTKFTVINDDSRMSETQIKHLCYAMCHIYFDNFCINDVPFSLELAQQFAKKAAKKCIGRNDINRIDSIDEIIENFSRKVRIHGYLEVPVDDE
uniref:Protein argonaute-2-like n=1 Tax=Dermatophagoides pteronyssinus TaxID=6956 RepID=A0A6P6XMC7_DERPT|nr:protein argonaute-2-like [Dermatophagoides pteronyssinus]